MATALDDVKVLISAWRADADDFRQAQLCGLLSVAAVREFELQIKTFLIDYAARRHPEFSQYISKDIARLNGKVSIEDINDRLSRFGPAVKNKFVELHQQATVESLENYKVDVVNGYNAVISNRHSFVHQGNLTLSLDEAQKYVELSPHVLACVNNALL